MKKTQKPMMLAYLIFLFICICYYMVSGIFGLEFAAWNRVVVAATIASYFFSLGSMDKLLVKLETTNINGFEEEMLLLKKIQNKERELPVDLQMKQELLSEMDQWIKETDASVMQGRKELRKHERKAFWNDVLGFLVFFCIIVFDFLYKFFSISQEVYTLAAFVVVIAIEYLESTKIAFYEEIRRNTIDKTKAIYTRLEDLNNG